MADEKVIESILVADCGTVFTKLLLLEKVEESYRFVAQAETLTTINPPWSDVSVGVVHAIEELEQITGRTLLVGGTLVTPQDGMEGVDAFVVILTAPEPLRLVLAGLVREVSLESARRAAAGTYTRVEAVLSREGSVQMPEEQWARTVRDVAPDVVFLVGGVDGGATQPVIELAEAIAFGGALTPNATMRPVVLYAGNAQLRTELTKKLKPPSVCRRLEVVDNAHPSADTEHLGPAQEILERLYVEERLLKTPGVETLMSWSRLPLLPASTTFGRVIEYLWHKENNSKENNRPEYGALGVDIGAASTTVAATFEKQLYLSVHGQSGIAYGPLDLVREYGIEALLRWIPEEMDPNDVLAFLYNRELRPWTIPQDVRELWIEQAVVREMLRRALRIARPTWSPGRAQHVSGMMPRLDPILISGGGIVHMPHPGQALLNVLDGLEPIGISKVYLDVNRAAAALGAVAGVKPLAAAAALEAGALVPLGTVISPVGRATPGEPILKVKISYEDGAVLNIDARYGEMEILPLGVGQQATLELKPLHRFDVGLGGSNRGGKIQAVGGLVGLVVDARGRPLDLPDNPDQRRNRIQRWIWAVGG